MTVFQNIRSYYKIIRLNGKLKKKKQYLKTWAYRNDKSDCIELYKMYISPFFTLRIIKDTLYHINCTNDVLQSFSFN